MSRRPFTFREAEPSDLPGVEQLFESPGKKRGWAAWKYLHNPDGVARVFIAEDTAGKVVSSLVHLPRRFTSRATGIVTVLQVVDIFILPDLRQQGVFLGLLAHAHRRMTGPRIGVPNSKSRVFGEGLGWRPIGPYDEWEFPVLSDKALAQTRLRTIAPLATALARVYEWSWLRRDGRIEMRPIERFARDFALDPAVLHGIRSADYLNWRFIDNPLTAYRAFEFVEGDEPLGYCVYALSGGVATLCDLVTLGNAQGCLRLLVDHCHELGVDRVRLKGTGLKLGGLGFLRRRSSEQCLGIQAPEGPWLIMPCDTDLEPALDETGVTE